MKNYDKNKVSNLNYWDMNNLYGCAMSQKFPAGGFKWVDDTSHKNYQ